MTNKHQSDIVEPVETRSDYVAKVEIIDANFLKEAGYEYITHPEVRIPSQQISSDDVIPAELLSALIRSPEEFQFSLEDPVEYVYQQVPQAPLPRTHALEDPPEHLIDFVSSMPVTVG